MTIYTQADIDRVKRMLIQNVLQTMEGGRMITFRSRDDQIATLRMMIAEVHGSADPNVPVRFSRGET
jgi:cell division protein FtsX